MKNNSMTRYTFKIRQTNIIYSTWWVENIRVWLGMGCRRYVLIVKKCSNLKTKFTTTNKNQTNNKHNIYYKDIKSNIDIKFSLGRVGKCRTWLV
jgi:predicted DNA-binding ArsR family transcriptional regulator